MRENILSKTFYITILFNCKMIIYLLKVKVIDLTQSNAMQQVFHIHPRIVTKTYTTTIMRLMNVKY